MSDNFWEENSKELKEQARIKRLKEALEEIYEMTYFYASTKEIARIAREALKDE